MFQQLSRWFRRVISHHIACWPEELSNQQLQYPTPDVTALRSSLNRFFRYHQTAGVYVFLYEPAYEKAIDVIREEGMRVQLLAGEKGELFYEVSINDQVTEEDK